MTTRLIPCPECGIPRPIRGQSPNSQRFTRAATRPCLKCSDWRPAPEPRVVTFHPATDNTPHLGAHAFLLLLVWVNKEN